MCSLGLSIVGSVCDIRSKGRGFKPKLQFRNKKVSDQKKNYGNVFNQLGG